MARFAIAFLVALVLAFPGGALSAAGGDGSPVHAHESHPERHAHGHDESPCPQGHKIACCLSMAGHCGTGLAAGMLPSVMGLSASGDAKFALSPETSPTGKKFEADPPPPRA